jgi:hypothetical protein
MPEEQNVVGEAWNKRLNSFLSKVLLWTQLGPSNSDIYCADLRKKVGIDSVFSYKRNSTCNQQVVLIEAKTVQQIGNLRRTKIEEWVQDLVSKLSCVPHSPEFHEKFLPDSNALYALGLIALWVRGNETCSHDKLSKWLTQIAVPRKRTPLNIGFISNRTITNLCTIHDTIKQLTNQESYESIRYYFPVYGRQPPADGSCIPMEALLSKFIFCKADKLENIKGKDTKNRYPAYIVFYLGSLTSYPDLRFIGLALKHFQLIEANEVEIFTQYDPLTIRHFTETFNDEFRETNLEFAFRQLVNTNYLPDWM